MIMVRIAGFANRRMKRSGMREKELYIQPGTHSHSHSDILLNINLE
jgi:hypothetical protein